MIESLNEFDTQLFYLINGFHCESMDWPMWFISSRWSWLLALVAAYLFVAFKQEKKYWWIPLAAIGLCFLLADRGSVLLFKDTVCRPRPCQVLNDVHLLSDLEPCRNSFGFVSSHAANAFALVTFFWLRYRKTKVNLVSVCLLIWAVAVCYSRVYLGKHYPGDVVCGALFGMLVGWLVWFMMKKFEKKFIFNETKS